MLRLATGATNVSRIVKIVDDAGLPVTGLVAATFPDVYIEKPGVAAAQITPLSDLAAIDSAHSDGGVFEYGGGDYRLDVPDTYASTAVDEVNLRAEATDKRLICSPASTNPVLSQLTTRTVTGDSSVIAATGADSDTLETLSDQLDGISSDAAAAVAAIAALNDISAVDVWAAATRTLTALDEDVTTLDLDATIRAALGMASANLDTQLATIVGDTAELQTVLSAGILARSNNSNLNALLGVPDIAGAKVSRTIHSGTAQAGSTSSTLKLAGTASTVNSFYLHRFVQIVSGTGVGQHRVINGYTGGVTLEATVTPSWDTTPDATSVYEIYGSAESHVRQIETGAIVTGSFAAGAVNATVAPNLDAAVSTRASQTSVDTVDDLLDTEIASIISDLQTLLANLATVDSTADAILLDTGTDGVVVASLNSAALDSIHDEPITEPSARPAWASMTHRKLMQVLGVMMLNEANSDADSVDFRNDADTLTLWSYPSSDDGTTYTSGEAA